MNEFLGESINEFEALVVKNKDLEIQNAIEEVQAGFEANYNDFFHNPDYERRKRLGTRIITCMDYVNTEKPEPEVEFRIEASTLRLPLRPIVVGFESIMEPDRDSTFMPIKQTEYDARLPVMRNAAYSPKIGLFLQRTLYLQKRFFVLNPDEDIKRGVEQIIASVDKEKPPLGEIWLARKWLNLPDSPETFKTKRRELVESR